MDDVLRVVASYVEPNPVVYCQLALVSKSFFFAFTSDCTWRFLNPYNVDRDIYPTFLEKLTMDDRHKMPLYWTKLKSHEELLDHPLKYDANLYLLLGCFIHRRELDTNIDISRHLYWSAININPWASQWAPPEFAADRECALLLLSRAPCFLSWLDASIRADKELVLKAISQPCLCSENCIPFMGASPELQRDRQVVEAAIPRTPTILAWCSNELKRDRELVLLAVKHLGSLLHFLPFSDDREIVMAAVANCADALHSASDRLKDDREVVSRAISLSPTAIKFASERLQNDYLQETSTTPETPNETGAT